MKRCPISYASTGFRAGTTQYHCTLTTTSADVGKHVKHQELPFTAQGNARCYRPLPEPQSYVFTGCARQHLHAHVCNSPVYNCHDLEATKMCSSRHGSDRGRSAQASSCVIPLQATLQKADYTESRTMSCGREEGVCGTQGGALHAGYVALPYCHSPRNSTTQQGTVL